MKLIVSASARADMDRIRAYTLHRWGEKQLGTYTLILEKALRSIERRPETGKWREGSPRNVKSLKAGRHIIFYRIADDHIIVNCVLHERMDFGRRLE